MRRTRSRASELEKFDETADVLSARESTHSSQHSYEIVGPNEHDPADLGVSRRTLIDKIEAYGIAPAQALSAAYAPRVTRGT